MIEEAFGCDPRTDLPQTREGTPTEMNNHFESKLVATARVVMGFYSMLYCNVLAMTLDLLVYPVN